MPDFEKGPAFFMPLAFFKAVIFKKITLSLCKVFYFKIKNIMKTCHRLCIYVGIMAIILTGGVSCSKSTEKASYSCRVDNPIIRVATKEKGQLLYLENQGVYAIRVVSGIDSESFYIVCSLPSSSVNINDSVFFSGNIRSSTIKPQAGGQNYYELEASNISDGGNAK